MAPLFCCETEYHSLCDKIGTQKSKWGIKPIHRHAVTRRPINLKCFKKYVVNEVFRKIAFCDRTGNSIFESPVIEPVTVKSAVLVIEPVTVLFMLYGIESVIVFFRML